MDLKKEVEERDGWGQHGGFQMFGRMCRRPRGKDRWEKRREEKRVFQGKDMLGVCESRVASGQSLSWQQREHNVLEA